MRYEVYTLRRTSSRTVYAIYDNRLLQPVRKNDGTNQPVTTTDRYLAKWIAREWEKKGDAA